MKSGHVLKVQGRRLGGFLAQIILISLVMAAFQVPVLAAGTCHSSGPVSGAYTVEVCITAPANGAILTGNRNVTATAVVTAGTGPGFARLVFYLGGEYLLTDFQTPFTFTLPTTQWVDGGRSLEVEALMKDGFTSERTSISVTLLNGIVEPPVNPNTFTPRTGTTPPAGQAFTLAVSGDGAGGMTTAEQVADLIDSWSPNLFLYLGDVYEDGTYTEFHNWYGTNNSFFNRFRSITDPTVGNHEYRDAGTAKGYFNYWDNIDNYYSFDAAGWHIIALNSNCVRVGGCHANSPIYHWLAADLAAHPNVCTIAFYHHPVYFVGPVDDPQNMNAVWALLAQNGVDIVFNGHDHNYQRWKPMDGTGTVASGGVTEFVVAAGGHGIQEFARTDPRLAKGFDTPSTFGALRLQLNQDGAGYQYINTAGVMMDSGSVLCSGAPADVISPSKPTNLHATAIDSNMVELTWKASTDNVGVTGYSIYRDGSLLTTVPPVTRYRDNTALPNTTYSYRIRARDAAGKVSSLSSTVSVTTPSLLFSDGFEGGNFQQWTSVSGFVLQQQQVYAGTRAIRGTSSGTPTYAYKDLSQTHDELYYRLWFKVLSKGANPILLQRFRTAASNHAAIMSVSITTAGKLSFRNDVSGLSTTSTTAVTTGVWHQLQTRILINGAAGETEFWLDGVRIDSISKIEDFSTTPVGRIQLGDTTSGRIYDIALDRVAMSTNFIDPADPPEDGTPPPTHTPTSTPTPTSIPTATPTATATQTPSPVGINVWVGPNQEGSHSLPQGGALRVDYPNISQGPVKMMGSGPDPIVGSEAVVYSSAGVPLSFSEIMGLPAGQVDKVYWLPWYNNVTLDTQLRFANVSGTTATVRVLIGGREMSGSPFTLAAGASTRKSFAGIDRGPVKIVSAQNIVAAERVIYKAAGGTPISFSEMMALPNKQLDRTYWLPWYNNVTLDTQLRFANVSINPATVHIYIAGQEMPGSPFSLPAGASTRKSFAGIDRGPVKIVSNVNIVAAERVIYKVNGSPTSFSEMMAWPNKLLHKTYWLPWYNNVTLDTQLRFANVGISPALVHVFIGGQEMPGSPFTLDVGQSTRKSFTGKNTGPVKIVSTQNIVAAERVIQKANGTPTSFSEMMGLPAGLLDTTYWLPWYNNKDLFSRLHFAVP
jgi:hypothetical protein